MVQGIIIFIVGVVAGFLVAWGWYKRKMKEGEGEVKRTQKEAEKEREMFGGFDEYNEKMARVKKERKDKIVLELEKARRVRAGEVADLLDISKVTAFRYLEELQQEGVIEQVGKTGRDVEYNIRQK